MKAIAYSRCLPVADPAALEDVTLPDPGAPAGRDLLVEVRAVGVNPLDAKLRGSADPAGKPRILGFEGAGVVRAAGPLCTLLRPGDAVFWTSPPNRPGSNAELALVDERGAARMPANLSFAEAAAMPVGSLTAHEALFDRLRLPRATPPEGAALLIIGGAGGVGSAAIQLARALTPLRVVATASRPESREFCLAMGAHAVLDHGGDLVAQGRALGVAFPWIFSTTGTAGHWKALCSLVAPQGLICAIDDVPGLDAARLRGKSAGLVWEGMFVRALFDTPDRAAQHAALTEVAGLLAAGRMRSTLTRHLGPITAQSLRAGHALVEEGRMLGKAVAEGWA